METIDQLQDALASEMDLQSKYNLYLLNISNPEVRQFFTQMRDAKLGHVTGLQQKIAQLMQGKQ
jgi:rubrerythrin